MTRDVITPASDGQMDSILRLIQEVGKEELRKLGLDKDDAQRLLGKGGEFKSELAKLIKPVVERFSTAPNIVVVPDLTAVELTAAAKRDLKLTYLDSEYATWDYYRDLEGNPIEGRGLKFEALVWKPELGSDEAITSEAVRAYFRERGFSGHTGAFTQWRRQNPNLTGYHASIPEDGACWRRSDGHLFVPYSLFDDEDRELLQRWIGDGWRDYWSFVAFRVFS